MWVFYTLVTTTVQRLVKYHVKGIIGNYEHINNMFDLDLSSRDLKINRVKYIL